MPMPRPARTVHVIVCANDRGQTPILTGLALLARRGLIRFSQEMRPWPPMRDYGPVRTRDKHDSSLTIVVDGRRRAYVDIHDAWDIEEPECDEHDVYFKRSYARRHVPDRLAAKVMPLGLICEVRNDGLDLHEAYRTTFEVIPAAERLRNTALFFAKTAAAALGAGPRVGLSLLTSPPRPDLAPRLQFNVLLYDPDAAGANAEQRREYEAVTALRAGCVRLLRRELGERFVGGAIATPYALRHHPDIVLADPGAASRRRYIASLRRQPIAIATTGLHLSNGFKLAEYVGLSRAILSEPLHYEVPGDFAAGRNYLQFQTPEQCLHGALSLLEDRGRRAAMMEANWRYYNDWLRPESMAWRVVETTATGIDAGPGAPLTAD
jgi:hypothetical protein